MALTSRRGSHRARILIVDDDVVIREYGRSALEAIGMTVECAEDGESGLQRFCENRPDLVLMDVSMPGMDGFETCLAIRMQPGGQEVPIIIATGLDDHESMARAFDVGATDFITKPLAAPVLQNRIRFTLRAVRAIGALQESQRQLGHAQAVARLGSWQLDLGSRNFVGSGELRSLLELAPAAPLAVIGDFLERLHPEDRDHFEKGLVEVEERQGGWSSDHRIVTAAGSERVVNTSVEHRHQLPGDAGVIVGTVQDITLRKATEEEIRRLANFDSLTALPNRRFFNERLDRSIEAARRNGEKMALLFLDIDRFKRINDTLGHAAGDHLLKELAKRLLELVRLYDGIGRPGEGDSVGLLSRLGGDEFTVFLTRLRESSDAARVARRILEAVGESVQMGDQEIEVSASIGIAIYPDDADEADALQRHADTAMYDAKREGGGRYRFFSRRMSAAADRKLELETHLRRDLQAGRIEVHYQPTIDARSLEVRGVEALARWRRDGEGLVSPAEFIPVAEENGLIDMLGEQVLRKACQELSAIGEDAAGLRLAVNISSVQLRRPACVEGVSAILAETGFDPRRLDLEITESVLLEDGILAGGTLTRLKELGLGLALDDFGTGYASMSYLRKVPIGALKVDRSFTTGVPGDAGNAAIVSATIAMASRLGLLVTVEGIEERAEAEYVRDQGCDVFQGFLISQALPIARLEAFLRGWEQPGSARELLPGSASDPRPPRQ